MCDRVGSTHVTNWFRSWKQKYPKCKREGAVGVDGESDEYNSNERRILRDRSAILLGFKILLAEAYCEDVQALFGILSGNQGLVV